MTPVKRIVLIVAGLASLALGAIGIFVPLLPTTPLVLLAAFCFANSSERLHLWLLDHNVFGPLIDNWRRYGAISRSAKTSAVLSMAAVFALSVLMLPPMVIVAEKMRRARAVFRIAVAMLIAAELGLAASDSYALSFAMLVLFFGAFNFLEAMLPAGVTRIAPADMKGTAMGLFSSAQFLGAFTGGLVGGLLLSSGDYRATFAWLAAILCLWLGLAFTMKPAAYLKSKIVSLQALADSDVERFLQRARQIAGVHEVSVYELDRVAYLKVDKSFDERNLDALIQRS